MGKCPYLCIVRYHFKNEERYLRNSHLTMKKLLFTLSLVGVMTFTACGLQRGINDLSLGMSKAEVTSILGKPHLRNLNASEEVWQYFVSPYIGTTDTYTISFKNERLSSFNSVRKKEAPQSVPVIIPEPEVRIYPQSRIPERSRYGQIAQEEAEREFKEFLSQVKRQTFTKDMIAYVRDAARYQRFSSLQVKRILQLFSWDSERLDVLRILAPSMTDGYKVHEIIETFDFSSGRDEARRILRTAQQTEPIIIQTPEWSQYDRRAQEEAEQEFKEFLTRVKRQTFTKDMIAYVRDAARYQRFSSLQVKRILQLFSWDSERLDVLRILAPTMTDGYKVHEIIETFDFSSGKDEARRILGITR